MSRGGGVGGSGLQGFRVLGLGLRLWGLGLRVSDWWLVGALVMPWGYFGQLWWFAAFGRFFSWAGGCCGCFLEGGRVVIGFMVVSYGFSINP